MDSRQCLHKPVRILLVCANGISTSLLMCKAEKHLKPGDSINAAAYVAVQSKIRDHDVVLLAPQMRAYIGQLGKLCEEYQKPYGWIDMKTYGSLDGETVIKTAYNLLQNYDA